MSPGTKAVVTMMTIAFSGALLKCPPGVIDWMSISLSSHETFKAAMAVIITAILMKKTLLVDGDFVLSLKAAGLNLKVPLSPMELQWRQQCCSYLPGLWRQKEHFQNWCLSLSNMGKLHNSSQDSCIWPGLEVALTAVHS
jgi:hypothetical protein